MTATNSAQQQGSKRCPCWLQKNTPACWKYTQSVWHAPADNSHSLSGFQQMLQSLPCPSVPSFFHPCNVKHSNCVWFFVGCNPHPSEPLDGRAEHVDSVTNDGLTALFSVRGWSVRKINRLMRRLRAKDFVQCSSSVWSLTPSGRSRGLTIQRNHRLWTQYLTSHADIAANHVDWSVDQVEHVLSDDLVAQLEDQLRLGAEP